MSDTVRNSENMLGMQVQVQKMFKILDFSVKNKLILSDTLRNSENMFRISGSGAGLFQTILLYLPDSHMRALMVKPRFYLDLELELFSSKYIFGARAGAVKHQVFKVESELGAF